MKVLVGDIGGTNSRLAIFVFQGSRLHLEAQHTYSSAEYSCVAEIVSTFLHSQRAEVELVCLGLPGPVSSDPVIQLTNLPWQVEHERLRQASGTTKVTLINDVEASAVGVLELRENDRLCLHEGLPIHGGMRTVISVGTGLGVANLLPGGEALATEAGHTSFAPRNSFDIEFLRDLQREFGHVSWERVASGPSIPRIYARLATPGTPPLEAPDIVGRFATDDVCRRTMEVFCTYLGSVAGNIALTTMPRGGVFLCGGVAPRVVEECGARLILEAFLDKGRMRKVVEQMPVYLVSDGNLALTGAAHIALRRLKALPA